MNEPKLYNRANQVQRRDAKLLIEEFGKLLQWRRGGGDRILDVGCGSGDVTMDFLVNILPRDYEQLVATDSCLKMLKFAEESYGKKSSKIIFKYLDIGADSMPQKYLEYFHHITSFYCLHWIIDQKLVT